MNVVSEHWLPVPGYDDLYQLDRLSNRVRNAKSGKILPQARGSTVRLSRNGIRRDYHINAIVRAVAQNKALLA